MTKTMNDQLAEIHNKGIEKIKEFVLGEIDDYSYFDLKEIRLNEGYENSDEEIYCDVEIKDLNDNRKTLTFHYLFKEDKIEVELSEDNFEEVNDYTHLVKFFWMALLKW